MRSAAGRKSTAASPPWWRDTGDSGRSGGLVRLDFGRDDDRLEVIGWDEWFEVFEESKLALLIDEDKVDSRFNKLVSRD